MATGVEVAAGGAASACCLNCCCNQFEQYIAQAEHNVRDLESEAVRLAAMAKDLQNKVSARQLGSIANVADNWLRRSGGVQKAAKEVSEDWAAICLPSLNLWSRYRVGRRAFRLLKKAKALVKEISAKLEASTAEPREKGLQEKQIETRVVGIDPYLMTALGYITGDAVGVVGICGMGGVGKTTLLRKIHGEFLPGKARSKEFEKIVWAVVPKKSTTANDAIQNDIASLQNDIARELCLLLDPVHDNDNCSMQVLEKRAQPIYEYLSSKSFLLLLDDLWSPLELRSIGIPDPNSGASSSHKHKVVLTSRSETVCGQMQAASGLINVRCLEEADAWRLFEFNATKQTIASHKDIRGLAWEVMKECQGLPLALNAIGKALSTKSGDPKPWKAALKKLRAASLVDIPGMEVETAAMLHRLKISYDYLPSQRYKDCFLSCCLWPEDYSIEKAELIECWLGLGIIPDSRDTNTCLGIITSLKEVNLLEPGDDDATEVKMHDTLRDMSLWISSGCGKTKNKWLVKSGAGTSSAQMVLKQWHEGSAATERVSLMNNFIEELPSEHIPERTRLQVLMLQRNTSLRVVPGSFLQRAPSLTYLDLSNTAIEELPGEICLLRGLQYLNLSHSHISKLPEGLSFLTELRCLLASTTICLSTMPYGIISKLRKLQVLDVFQSNYTSWDVGIITSSTAAASASNGENDNCACLSEFTDTGMALKWLGITVDTVETLKKLARYDMVRTKRLCLKRVVTTPSLHVLPSSLSELLGGLDMLRSLQEFMLSTCVSLKEIIIDGGGGGTKQIEYGLPELEKLKLAGLYNLEQIRFHRITANDFFPSLCLVEIFHCFELKNVNWLLHLPQLLHIELQFCDAMKTLVDDNDDMEHSINEIHQEQHVKATFPLLKTLTIHSLGNLTSLCSSRSVDFPALEILSITQCSNMKQLNIRPHAKLKEIRGGEKWWNGLGWEDNCIREELLPYFKAPRLKRA